MGKWEAGGARPGDDAGRPSERDENGVSTNGVTANIMFICILYMYMFIYIYIYIYIYTHTHVYILVYV